MVRADKLAALGDSLMSEAEQLVVVDPRAGAILYRDGLVIALLIALPIRRRNLAMMRVDRHLIRDEMGYCMAFDAQETKTGERYDAPLPDELTDRMHRYLSVHRPIIAGAHDHDGLWASMKRCPMTPEALYERIQLHTRAAFGHSVNPHLFRDIAATTLAIEDPANVQIASDLLGHSDPSTTERYYIQASMVEASRKYRNTVLALRDESGGVPDKDEER